MHSWKVEGRRKTRASSLKEKKNRKEKIKRNLACEGGYILPSFCSVEKKHQSCGRNDERMISTTINVDDDITSVCSFDTVGAKEREKTKKKERKQTNKRNHT